MAKAEKFLFKTDFDDGNTARKRGKEEAEARQRAALIEEGRQQGLAEARVATEHLAAASMGQIRQALELLHADRQAIEAAMSESAMQIALALVRKILPRLARHDALGEIEGLVADCLRQLLGEPRLVIRVHDQLLDALREHLGRAVAECGFDGDLVLIADPALALGDCRIEWADGGAERDVQRLWQQVERASSRFFAEPGANNTQHDHPAPLADAAAGQP